MRNTSIRILLFFLLAGAVQAVPTLQLYTEGATAGDYGYDQDSWIYWSAGSFPLTFIGAFGGNVTALRDVTLVFSVPEGDSASVSVDGNPAAGVFATKAEANPILDSFNNHYPFQDDVSDFLLYEVGDFEDPVEKVADHDATSGTISPSNTWGVVEEFLVEFSGTRYIHVDVIAEVVKANGRSSWEINPGSHDVTDPVAIAPSVAVPAPGALLLGSLGVSAVGWLRRRKSL